MADGHDIIQRKGGNILRPLGQAKKRDHKIFITDMAIEKVAYVAVPDMSEEVNLCLRNEHRELLQIAKEQNNSNEVSTIISLVQHRKAVVLGDEFSVQTGSSPEAMGIFSIAATGEIMYLHNHPSTNNFSLTDIATFLRESQIGLLSVVTNQGTVYILHKNKNYSFQGAATLFTPIVLKYQKKLIGHNEAVKAFLKICEQGGIDYVRSK